MKEDIERNATYTLVAAWVARSRPSLQVLFSEFTPASDDRSARIVMLAQDRLAPMGNTGVALAFRSRGDLTLPGRLHSSMANANSRRPTAPTSLSTDWRELVLWEPWVCLCCGTHRLDWMRADTKIPRHGCVSLRSSPRLGMTGILAQHRMVRSISGPIPGVGIIHTQRNSPFCRDVVLIQYKSYK